MSSCARCCVHESMVRHGRGNVVEIVGREESSGWIPRDIYTSDARGMRHDTKPKFSWNGADWYWIMTVYSDNHSLDEDCSNFKSQKNGFPVRISVSDPDWYF